MSDINMNGINMSDIHMSDVLVRYDPPDGCMRGFLLLQVDFASTFLDTPGEFISIWSEVETLTWSEVQSATPVFATMGSILGLAIIFAGLGWRFDQKVDFLQLKTISYSNSKYFVPKTRFQLYP